MFKITRYKGFQVTFDNGWTVSVQFGPGNYCENYNMDISKEGDIKAGGQGSSNAEIAAWDANNKWYDFGDDKIKGRVTPNEVLEFMNMIAIKEGA